MLTGKGTHATLVSGWRVLPCSSSSSGLVVGMEWAWIRQPTGRSDSKAHSGSKPGRANANSC